MFYYPNVLHRHTGCFSTIWLAATRGIRVTRRELLTVNVKRTCRDIVSYVTAQVPPPQPNQPRPRFSLYLSSQLQYGVVVVYHSQCGFLLEEIQQTIDRLLRTKRCTRIDMAASDRLVLNVPDNLYMMKAAEGAQDPFFGLMESEKLLSPYKIPKTTFLMEELGSQGPLVSSSHTTPVKEAGFRSTPGAITLPEKEQFVINTAEYFEGDDLPEVTAREIDFLMDQPEMFCRETEGQLTGDRIRDLELAMSSIDQLNKTAVGAERDSAYLLTEDLGQTLGLPLASKALEMTPQQVAMPTPPSDESYGKEGNQVTEGPYEEMTVGSLRKSVGRRRRQLVFADPQVQISDRAMKEQIGNPLAETLDQVHVLSSLDMRPTPSQLFSAPCGSLPHADLQLLWKQSALLTALPAQEEEHCGEEKEDTSEQDREILRTERRRSSVKQMSTESGLRQSEGSSLSLDISKEDKSGSDVITPVGRWSSQEDIHPFMEPIAEENVEMPQVETDTESRNILSWIFSNLQRSALVTFYSLLPPEADRTTAAHTLYKLLELLSAGQVTVQQAEPYSTMIINTAYDPEIRTAA